MGVDVVLAADVLLDQVVLALVAEDDVDLARRGLLLFWRSKICGVKLHGDLMWYQPSHSKLS